MKPLSTTHLHLLNVISSELSRRELTHPVRLLDLGCGSGDLILYLSNCLSRRIDDIHIEIYGLEVQEHAGQAAAYLDNLLLKLRRYAPNTSWEDRIYVVSSHADWPFEQAFFDVVLSNQVLEHIINMSGCFHNLHRVLKPGGFSVHLFPLRNVIWEGHLQIPLAHRFASHDNRKTWIRSWSRLGVGRYSVHRNKLGVSVDEYAEYQSDYIHYYTSYRTYHEFAKLAKRHSLRASLRYTPDYFLTKLQQLFRRPRERLYSAKSGLFTPLAEWALSRISSVTLFLERENRKKLGDIPKS